MSSRTLRRYHSTLTVTMLAAVVLGIFLFSCWWYLRRPAGLPPGPARFPLVGSPLLYMGDVRKQLTDLRKHYGDVSTVYFGGRIVVVLNGVKTIKDTFRMQVFSERPDSLYHNEIAKGKGITNTPNWRDLRGLVVRSLRELGVGRSAVECKIIEQLDIFVQDLSSYSGQYVDPRAHFKCLAFNIMCSIVLGKKVFSNYEDFIRYSHKVTEVDKAVGPLHMLTLFPWLRLLPGDLFEYNKTLSYYNDLFSFHERILEEHTKTYTGQEPRDLLDCITQEQQKIRTGGRKEYYPERELVATIHELMVAGSETPGTTLGWAIVFLMRHPEIQCDLQEEVDRYLGNDGVPTYSMRQNMTKMEAFVLECNRLGDVGPFGLPHMSSDDATINGYKIPKGTTIFANLHGVSHDPEIWGDPEVFRPWRFLTEDGKINKDLTSCVIPFSTGKRECVGEALANIELFLIWSLLLQKFLFYPPDGCDPFTIGGELGLLFTPKPYQVLVKTRDIVT